MEVGATLVLPAAIRYQTELATNLGALKSAGFEGDSSSLEAISVPLGELRTALATLRSALADDSGSSPLEEATHAKEVLLPAMTAVRAASDAIETLVADDLWPLPTYQEMLYVL